MSDTSKLTLLGNNSTKFSYDSPDSKILEVFENQHKDTPYVIGLHSLEFTSLCPMTGQPDYGIIRIVYVADALCIESKSLKFYLVSYRNYGAFHEDCVNRIANDIVGVINPHYIRVFGDFNVRGGIAIKPLAIRRSEGQSLELKNEIESLIRTYDQLNPNTH